MVAGNILTGPLSIRQMHFCLGPRSRKWKQMERRKAQRGRHCDHTKITPGCRTICMGMLLLLSKADYEKRAGLWHKVEHPSLFCIAMFPPRSLSLRKALYHTASLLAASLKHKNHHRWHRYPVQLSAKSFCSQLPSYSLNGNNVDPSLWTQLFPSLLTSVL